MEVHIIAVGKMPKKSPEAELFGQYTGRVPWKTNVTEIEAKKAHTDAERCAEENQKIRAAIPEGAFTLALDSRGKALSSEQLAAQLGQARDTGFRTIAFLMGGADGLDADTLNRANLKLSLGPMIWPHMLARVMLSEQLFRAHAIQTRHPYHRASGQDPKG